jgi:hypothetical protein
MAERVAAIIERANRHAARLIERGLVDRLREVFGVEPGWLIEGGEPASEDEVRAVEDGLGFALPPSYRRFLLEHGQLTFYNHWCDETTPVGELVEISRSLAAQVVETHGRAPLVAAIAGNPHIVRFADFRNHTAEYIFIANFRDAGGEAPSFMWFHDDVFGDAADLEYAERVAREAREHAVRPAVDGGGVAPVDTELTRALGETLGGDGNQRDRLAAIERELGERLAAASGAELVCALHAIRKTIKSPKLAARRDELIAGWHEGPLPRLARRADPAPLPRGFDTFADWLEGRLERQIEYIDDRLPRG